MKLADNSFINIATNTGLLLSLSPIIIHQHTQSLCFLFRVSTLCPKRAPVVQTAAGLPVEPIILDTDVILLAPITDL